MSINLDLPKAATEAVDEASKDLANLIAALPAETRPIIDYAIAKLQTLLVGRTITIKIS